MLKISKSGRIYTSTSSVQELLSELTNVGLLDCCYISTAQNLSGRANSFRLATMTGFLALCWVEGSTPPRVDNLTFLDALASLAFKLSVSQ